MPIVPQLAPSVPTSPQVLLLPAPKPRLMLSAPKIAGYLPMPKARAAGGYMDTPLRQINHVSSAVSIVPVKSEKRGKRVVVAEIVNPLDLIDIRRDPDAWLEEFDRIYGPSQTIEEMDAEIEAKYPGWIKLKESWS